MCIAFGWAAFALFACSEASEPARTRIVLITLDTLRYDRFSAGEDGASAMPRTWQHAKRGLVFDRFYTVSGVTQPAHATLFSGRAPWDLGITRNGRPLPAEMPHLVERLKQAGFETHGVVASFPLTRRFGYDRGFDTFVEDFSHNLSQGKAVWEGSWRVEEGAFFAMADEITARALAALDAARADQQFFWFHYFDPHAPYGASSGGDIVRKRDLLRAVDQGEGAVAVELERARARYDADVATLDRALDRVFERLRKDEATHVTHVFVVADHGESLGEDHVVGHGSQLQAAELRVPAFLLSARVDAGRSASLASTMDIAPTLLSLAGLPMLPVEADVPERGRDLTQGNVESEVAWAIRRTAREPGQSDRRLDGSQVPLDDYRFAAIDGDGAIHTGTSEGLLDGDGARPTPEQRTRFREAFARFEARLREFEQAEPLSPEVRRGLEALGYIE